MLIWAISVAFDVPVTILSSPTGMVLFDRIVDIREKMLLNAMAAED